MIKGIGGASGGGIDTQSPAPDTYLRSLEKSCREARVPVAAISLVEAHGSGNPAYTAFLFDGMAYPGNEDFDWTTTFDVNTDPVSVNTSQPYLADLQSQGISAAATPLSWLWEKAIQEWA